MYKKDIPKGKYIEIIGRKGAANWIYHFYSINHVASGATRRSNHLCITLVTIAPVLFTRLVLFQRNQVLRRLVDD